MRKPVGKRRDLSIEALEARHLLATLFFNDRASDSQLFMVDVTDQEKLLSVRPSATVSTPFLIGSMKHNNTPKVLSDIAFARTFNNGQPELYGVSNRSITGDGRDSVLYRILYEPHLDGVEGGDIALQEIGPLGTGINVTSLSFDGYAGSRSVLYGAGGSVLYTINHATNGSAQPFGTTGSIAPFTSLGDIAFGLNHRMFMTSGPATTAGTAADDHLVEVNLNPLSAQRLSTAALSPGDIHGLAYTSGDGNILFGFSEQPTGQAITAEQIVAIDVATRNNNAGTRYTVIWNEVIDNPNLEPTSDRVKGIQGASFKFEASATDNRFDDEDLYLAPYPTSIGGPYRITSATDTLDVVVEYFDASGVDVSTIGTDDVTVTGNGQTLNLVQVKSIDSGYDEVRKGPTVRATYSFRKTGGAAWTAADTGSYSISVVRNSVLDNIGNGTFGTTNPFTLVQVALNSTPQVNVAFNQSSVTEGSPLTFTLSRTSNLANALPVTLNFGGTAVAGVDYTPITNPVVIPANQTSHSVAVMTRNNGVSGNRNLSVTVVDMADYDPGTMPTAQATINDVASSPTPSVSVRANSPSTVDEGGALTYTFTRTGSNVSQPLVVSYTTGGTATSGTDYVAPSGMTTIPAGATSQNVAIATTDDANDEPFLETLILNVVSGSGYTVGVPSSAIGNIRDNDPDLAKAMVTASVTPASVVEGGTLTYRFTRTGDLTRPITVPLQRGGSAPTSDHGPISTSIQFNSGVSQVNEIVTTNQNTVVEGQRTLSLSVLAGQFHDPGTPATATATIQDDDGGAPNRPTVSVATFPASVAEDGTNQLTYTFTRTGATTSALNFAINVAGTATEGVDYPNVSRNMTFPIGQSTTQLTIDPTDDLVNEQNETISIGIAPNLSNYLVGASPGIGTIVNDDAVVPTLPTVTVGVNPATVAETGNGTLTYTFTRTGSTAAPLLVNYTTGGTATSGSDYPAPATPITISAGSSTATLVINPTDDANNTEGNETLAVNLTASASYTVGSPGSATGTIQDATAPINPTVNVSVIPTTVTESNSLTYRFTRTGSTTQTLNIPITSSGSATAGVDYVLNTANVSIPAGGTSADVIVPTIDDNLPDSGETLTITAGAGGNYTLGANPAATATINDNPNPDPIVSITAGQDVVEGGRGSLIYTFTRTGDTSQSLRVRYTMSGSTTPGADFVGPIGIVGIYAGETTARVLALQMQDQVVEPTETLTLTVLDGANYNVSGTAGAATSSILDDDTAVGQPSAQLPFVFVSAVNTPSPIKTFTFLRTGDLNRPITISYTVGGTTATGTITPTVQSLTFSPRVRSITIPFTRGSGPIPANATMISVMMNAGNTYSLSTNPMAVSATVSALQNQRDPTDVNTDGVTSPIDALLILNNLNNRVAEGEDANDPPTGFFDVSGDFNVSPLDALQVINRLRGELAPLAETEALSVEESLGSLQFGFEDLSFAEKIGQEASRIDAEAVDNYLRAEYPQEGTDDDEPVEVPIEDLLLS